MWINFRNISMREIHLQNFFPSCQSSWRVDQNEAYSIKLPQRNYNYSAAGMHKENNKWGYIGWQLKNNTKEQKIVSDANLSVFQNIMRPTRKLHNSYITLEQT